MAGAANGFLATTAVLGATFATGGFAAAGWVTVGLAKAGFVSTGFFTAGLAATGLAGAVVFTAAVAGLFAAAKGLASGLLAMNLSWIDIVKTVYTVFCWRQLS
jgi:hypothetical protein